MIRAVRNSQAHNIHQLARATRRSQMFGEKTIDIIDSNYDHRMMRVQMCEHLHDKKHLASVSRIMKAGHKVVFDPDSGSYMQLKSTGKKTWFREEGGVFYMGV